MSAKLNIPNENVFKDKMVQFYECCGVDEKLIRQIMREYDSAIGIYLAATPELVARKIYQEETGETL